MSESGQVIPPAPDTEAVVHRPLITEEWLRSVGFKWHQIERQQYRQWLLWLGSALGDERRMFAGPDDLGIEVSLSDAKEQEWNIWLRSDSAGLYHRFIHIRYIRFQDELTRMISALTGHKWDPELIWYGSMCRPKQAEYYAKEHSRMDMAMRRRETGWYPQEKDPDRSKPLAEHLEIAIESGKAK